MAKTSQRMCEYYCSGNQWWLVSGNPGSSYSCPQLSKDGIELACNEGSTTTVPAVPAVPTRPVGVGPEIQTNYAKYIYKAANGNATIRFIEGKCEKGFGFYTPLDLVSYSESHGEYAELIGWLTKHPAIHEAIIVVPAELISECRDKGHSPGHNATAKKKVAKTKTVKKKAVKKKAAKKKK